MVRSASSSDAGKRLATPAVPRSRAFSKMLRSNPSSGGLHHFRDSTSWSICLSSQVRHQPLQLLVLVLEGFQPLRVIDLEPPELSTPCVKRRTAEPLLTAQIFDRHAPFGGLQDPDYLLLGEATAFHGDPPRWLSVYATFSSYVWGEFLGGTPESVGCTWGLRLGGVDGWSTAAYDFSSGKLWPFSKYSSLSSSHRLGVTRKGVLCRTDARVPVRVTKLAPVRASPLQTFRQIPRNLC